MTGPGFDSQVFLETMRNVAATVTVVTTRDHRGAPQGLTVSAFSSVSLDPPLVLVCIGKESNTLDALLHGRGFTVNFLAEGAGAVALAVAAKDGDKFAGVELSDPTAAEAGPILAEHGFAHFECVTVHTVEAGDHWILIGEVVAGGKADDRAPLVYWRRSFPSLVTP